LRLWLIWAGLAFIVGGGISLALTLSIQGELVPYEDLSPMVLDGFLPESQ